MGSHDDYSFEMTKRVVVSWVIVLVFCVYHGYYENVVLVCWRTTTTTRRLDAEARGGLESNALSKLVELETGLVL